MKTFRLPLILIILILIGVVFRLLNSQSPFQPSPPPEASTEPTTILSQPDLTTPFSAPSSITSNFDPKNLPQFPASLPIYTVAPSSLDWYNQLAANLAFTASPQTYDQLHIWSQDNRSLIINTKTLTVSYTQPLPETISDLSRTNIESVIKPLLQKFTAANIWNTASLQIDHFSSPSQGNEGLIPSTSTSAPIAKVNLTPQLNNLPILTLNPYIGLLQITLNTSNHSLDLFTQLAAANFQEDQVYPLISTQEALTQLNQQQATVVQLQQTGKTYLDKTRAYSPQDTRITNLYLAYLFDTQHPTQPLQPIYVFSGTTTLENGQSATITLYLPAIDPNYLLAPSP